VKIKKEKERKRKLKKRKNEKKRKEINRLASTFRWLEDPRTDWLVPSTAEDPA
jgi:hypothetical protein